MEQDIKYTSPETRKAMIDYATENLVSTLSVLPGGNAISEKQYEKFKEQCKDTLGQAKTFEEMQQLINGMIQKIEIVVGNADVKMDHWQETEQRISDLKYEFNEKFSAIKDLEEQRDKSVKNISENFINNINGAVEQNPFDEFSEETYSTSLDSKIEISEDNIESINQAEFDNPFEDEIDLTEEKPLDDKETEKDDTRIIEREGQKYIVAKEAVYDEQNQLVEPGELRTLGACSKENMKQGHVVINKGTYNMVLTLDEFVRLNEREKDTQHNREDELDK